MDGYQLRKSESGKYLQFACAKSSDHIVRSVTMYGFGDCISFYKKNRDGSQFGSDWGLSNLGCFPEIGAQYRLKDMSLTHTRNLAMRMSRLLYSTGARATPILEELVEIQKAQKKAIVSGKITFPEISKEELANSDSW